MSLGSPRRGPGCAGAVDRSRVRQRSAFPRWLVLVAAVLAPGCLGEAPSGDAASAAPDAAARDRVPEGPGITGVLRDETGVLLPKETVLACMATVCLYGATDAQGRFDFPIEPGSAVALKTPENLSVTPRRAEALCPVRVTEGRRVDVGTLYVPLLPAGVPIGLVDQDPQTLALGDGLEVTLRRGDLAPRLGDVLIDAAARAIPPERRPLYPDLGAETVLAVYALHPFAATSTSPISVRAPGYLPAGTAVRFRTISEINGLFSDPIAGHSEGAFVTTDLGAGIAHLTHLVISQP